MESEELASIDDLLGGENEEKEEEDQFLTTEPEEADMGDDDQGFENDFNEPHLPLAITDPTDKHEAGGGVFCSDKLEDALEKDSELVGSVPVPRSLALKGLTGYSSEFVDQVNEQLERNEEGISAGLGQKKKTETKMRMNMKGRMMGGGRHIVVENIGK